MEDSMILNLYTNRDESALSETAAKYAGYCSKIAMNILHSKEDADECVNDTWLKAWESIPPAQPEVLPSFLGRITRNIALNLYKSKHTQKRGGSQLPLVLEELDECVRSVSDTEAEFESGETRRVINEFLHSIKEEPQMVFIRRYWYYDSVSDIAERLGMSESKVKSMLMRTRNKLKIYLEERGITV